MMLANAQPPDFLQRVADSLNVARESVVDVLWWAALLGFIFATLHLVTMLVTRWGDGDTVSKSLIFTVLVHISCMAGIVTFQATADLAQEKAPEPEDEVPIVTRVFVDAEEPVRSRDKGNTPVWDQLTKPMDRKLARLDHTRLEPIPITGPDRRPEPITPPDIETPDLPDLPDEPRARPRPRDTANEGNKAIADMPKLIDDKTAESRPDVRNPSPNFERRRRDRQGLDEEVTPERIPKKGSLNRVADELVLNNTLPPEFDARLTPKAQLRRGAEDDAIRTRSGPAPTPTDFDEAGTTTADAGAGTAGGASGTPRFERTKSRSPNAIENGSEDTLLTDRTPQTPSPVPGDEVAVRSGVTSDLPIDGPRPNVARPNFDAVNTGKRVSVPPTYRLRNLARRAEIARKFGGTDSSERAVETSLRWLALHQNLEGYWDPDGFIVHCPLGDRCTGRGGRALHGSENRPPSVRRAGLQADTGVTALAVLAFLGAGYTHEEGRYADQVDRALSWLIRQQDPDGSLAGNATRYARMYCHGMATYALAEAYGMQSDPATDRRLREPLARAVAYIVDQQNEQDGGWRYVKGQQSDMSMFGWQLMALKSAEIAGIRIPDEARARMIDFLKTRSLGDNSGLASYRILRDSKPPYKLLTENAEPTPTMTAEALFCKQMLGIKRDNPASQEAVGYLLTNQPKLSEQNLYYWYYGTLSMYQYGGEPWKQWNESLLAVLVSEQRTTGHAAGSWDPKGPWGPHGGRVYSTALATLCLEVYYRFLPLYKSGGRYE